VAAPTFIAASSAGTNTASATVTCNYPAGSASGDLLVMMAGFQRSPSSATAFSLNTPSGWTLLDSQNNSRNATFGEYGQYSATYYRFRGAETSVSVVATDASAMYGVVMIHAYTGSTVDATNPISVSAIQQQNSPTGSAVARPCPSVTTPTVDNAINCFAAIASLASGKTFSWGITKRTDAYTGLNADLYLTSATTTAASAGATGVFNITPSSGIDELHTATVAVQPPQQATVNGTDTASASDSASVIATTSTATDSGTGTEVAAITTTATADTGSGADTASVIAVSPPATDSGTGTDTAVANAVVFATDTANAVDTAFVKNTVLVSDSASAIDTAQITVQGTESGTSIDTATGIGFDTGTGVDTARVIINGAVDSALASETAFVSNTALPAPDTATAVEQPATITTKAADTAIATESVSTTANVPATDSATATESAKVIIQGAVDTGNAVDTVKIVANASDSAVAVDIATIIVTVFGVDTGVAADIAAVIVSGSDGGTAVDDAFKFVSGQILASRVTRIAQELRIVLVEREPRVLQIEPQMRKTVIGFEDRRVIKVANESREFTINAEV
jgi:epidermal growth factor receptor substrate 15